MGNSNSQNLPWPKLEGSHNLLPYSILCAYSWSSHPNGILSWDSQMGILKFPKLELLQLWGPITLCEDLRLKWSLKQSCSSCQKISNNMSRATCTQGNQVDSQLLVVRGQISNLTFGLSFGHNLCFRCPNGSCEPIFDIYILIVFQWYKELFNPLGFDSCNHSLNIHESTGTPTPKVGAPLGVWGFIPSHFLSLPGFFFWPATLQPLALVVSPRLALQHSHYEWKVKLSRWFFFV